MLGLVALENAKIPPPETTLEKFEFIVENLSEAHRLTTIVAFSALAILVFCRWLKSLILSKGGPRWKWVYAIPEIFLVVVGSTSKHSRSYPIACCRS